MTTSSTAAAPTGQPLAPYRPDTFEGYARTYLARIRGGDIGSLPAVLGLVVLCVMFAIVRPVFLTTGNFAKLFLQGAQVPLIANGLVFFIGAGVYLIVSRIEQAELNTRERLLQLELRIAEISEGRANPGMQMN